MTGRLISPRIQAPAPINLGAPLPSASLESPGAPAPEDDDLLRKLNARVVVLTGYIFFASVPSMEKQLLNSAAPAAFYILDLTRAHRIETAAARCLPRCVRDLEIESRVLIICGLVSGSGLHADFERAEVTVVFDATGEDSTGKGILAFATRAACLAWCQRQQETRMSVNEAQELDEQSQESAYRTFCRLFNFDLDEVLGAVEDEPHAESAPVPGIARFVNAGGRIRAYLAGEAFVRMGIAFVVEGQIELATPPQPAPDRNALRPSIQRLLTMLPRETLRAVRARWSVFSRRETASPRRFEAGDILDCRVPMGCAVANKRSVVVEMEGETLTAWAQAKLG